MWTLNFVALVALGLPDDASTPAINVTEVELETRLYDIHDLVAVRSWSDDALAMLPYRWASESSEFSLDEAESTLANPEDIVQLLRGCVASEYWDSDSGVLDVASSDALLVEAPSSVHKETARFLAFLRDVMVSRERLQISVYRGAVEGEPSERSREESAARLAALVEDGTLELLRSGSLALPSGVVQRMENVDVESIPYDWEVEIAQGATIAAAQHCFVSEGLSVNVEASRTADGTLVKLMMRQSDILDIDAYSLKSDAEINAKNGLTKSRLTGIVEHPRVSFMSFGGSVVLPPDRAHWIASSLDLISGGARYLVVVEVDGPRTPDRKQFAYPTIRWNDESGQQEMYHLTLQDTSAWCQRGMGVPSIPNVLFDVDSLGIGWEAEHLVMTFGSEAEPRIDKDKLTDLIVSTCRPDAWDEDPRNTIVHIGNWMMPSTTPEHAEEILEMLDRLNGQRERFVVRGTVKGAGGDTAGHFSVPLNEGVPTTLWSGVQSTALTAWGVEVASEVSCSYPEFTAVVDGFALVLELHGDAGGQRHLSVNGKLHLLRDEPRLIDYDVGDGRRYHKVRTRGLAIDDYRSLQPDGGALRWGDANIGLELSLTPIR